MTPQTCVIVRPPAFTALVSARVNHCRVSLPIMSGAIKNEYAQLQIKHYNLCVCGAPVRFFVRGLCDGTRHSERRFWSMFLSLFDIEHGHGIRSLQQSKAVPCPRATRAVLRERATFHPGAGRVGRRLRRLRPSALRVLLTSRTPPAQSAGFFGTFLSTRCPAAGAYSPGWGS
jgi:hypothetical protein